MTDLKFPELREYIENQTVIPEFGQVETRARRHRRRRRTIAALGTLACLVLVLPTVTFGASLLSRFYQPTQTDLMGIGGSGGQGDGALTTPTATVALTGPITTTRLLAVDGVQRSKVFDLVDLCVDHQCALQFGAFVGDSDLPQVLNNKVWVHASTEAVADAQVIVTGPTTVRLSARIGNATSPVTTNITVPTGLTPTVAPRPVQLIPTGQIQVVHPDAPVAPASAQPGLSYMNLVSATHGWWVTGQAPSGEFAVAVSRDQGATWTTHPLGILDTSNVAGLTTPDGVHVYLLVQSSGQIQLYYSGDGGNTWTLRPQFAGNAVATKMGAYVTRAKQLVVWYFDNLSGATTLFQSSDQGVHMAPLVGPRDADGRIVETAGNMYALGTSSAVSTDGGVNWSYLYLPADTSALAGAK